MGILIKHLPVRMEKPHHFSPTAIAENRKPVN